MNTIYDILLSKITHIPTSDATLFIIDENYDESLLGKLTAFNKLQVLTNRYDIHLLCQSMNINSYLNDFDVTQLQNYKEIKHCIYRISKERPVCHHIFNQTSKHLIALETFHIGGKKNEGIKNYHSKLCTQFPYASKLTKNGDSYTAALTKTNSIDKFEALEDKHYAELRPIDKKAYRGVSDNSPATGSIIQQANFHILTKPGQYGWNKIDKGSVILTEHLLTLADSLKNIESIMDLGCGYGFISLALLNSYQDIFPKLKTLCATDNNVAAVASCKENLSRANFPNIAYRAELDDCAKNEKKKFDLIVCNPPFHKGFSIDSRLSVKFISNAAQLLKAHGDAYFVVNEFIPLSKLAKSYFNEVEEVKHQSGFCVYRLSHGKLKE